MNEKKRIGTRHLMDGNPVGVALVAFLLCSRGDTLGQTIEFSDVRANGDISLAVPSESISVIDYDEDGFQDLLVTRSQGRYSLFHNIPDPARPGNRNFEDETFGSGLNDLDGPRSTEVQSVIAADYDRDGDPDFYGAALSNDSNRMGILFRNEGNGQFANVTDLAGVELTTDEPTAAAWGDYDLDGWIDLVVVAQFSPKYRLFRNEGNGSFSDATSSVQGPGNNSYAYSVVWTDVDQDGWLDLVTAFQNSSMVVLRNEEDGNGGRQLSTLQLTSTPAISPMGIAPGDYDADGDIDLAISVDANNVSILFENVSGTFQTSTPFTLDCTWGVNWFDGDNDGDLDLFSASCHQDPDDLFENLGGGSFADVSSDLNGGIASSLHSVRVDYNNDGLEDLFVNNPGQFVTVYENVTSTTNHWIKTKLIGQGNTNLDGIGATIRISSAGIQQVREVHSGSSTNASEDLRQHFGLGSSTVVDWIEVIWPRMGSLAARTERFDGPFAADQIITLNASVDLNLEIEPVLVSEGEDLTILTANGQPNGLALLVLVEADGTPLFLKVLLGNFDSNGEFLLSAPAPDLAGLDATFQTFGIGLDGKIKASNPADVSFQ